MGYKNTVYVGKIIADLKQIKSYARCVPKNIAPDQDPGVYFEKLLADIEGTIEKYEKIRNKPKKQTN